VIDVRDGLTSAVETGERMRRLRLIAGLGQTQLAARVGTSSGSISKLENGRMALSDELLERVSEVLDCSVRFLIAPQRLAPATRPWLRAYADASKRAVDRQVADCTTATELVDSLSLRVIPDTVPAFAGDLSDDDAIEQFALEVRAAAQIGEGEVVGNSIRAAERLGCLVLPMREELGRHVGLSIRSDLVPIICVSRPSVDPDRNVPGDRQRFTVAHELGHLSLHGALGPPESAADATRIERQAHRFAGAFLAPGDAMIEELDERGGRVTLRTLAGIKEHWGISIKALVMRFKSLGVIEPDQARSLYKQISARGWNKQEPVNVGNEQAVWLAKALRRRAGRDVDSIGTASRTVGIGSSHLLRWTDWSPIETNASFADILELGDRLGRNPRPADRGEGSVTGLPVRGL